MLKLLPSLILIILLTICIAVLATCNGCKQRAIDKLNADCGKEKVIYKEKIDTQILILPQQLPIVENVRLVKEYIPRIDSFVSYEVITDTTDLSQLKTAYFKLLQQYNTKRDYTDTAIFKNGRAIVNTEVKQNKLQSQKTILDSLRQEIITKTIYKPVRKGALYLGIDGYGNRNNGLTAAGFSLMWQTPRYLNYELGTYFDSTKNLNIRASIKIPLTKK